MNPMRPNSYPLRGALLALEWDQREARAVAARASGGSLKIEHILSIDLPEGDEATAEEIGERIRAALAARDIGGRQALVTVGRGGVELRQLSLPPAPDEELPEIVRFQAQRQFTALGEDWPLDYAPLESPSDETIEVLAAAAPPDRFAYLKDVCQAAGHSPQRLVLRPCASASLLTRRQPDDEVCRLLVDLSPSEVDLTVLAGRSLVVIRTVRRSGAAGSEAEARVLLGEIRRTMAAAQNRLDRRSVERIFLTGKEGEHAALAEAVESQLSLPVEWFDPFVGAEFTGEAQRANPDSRGKFASLVGMLADEAAGDDHAIDLLHPRQPPPPPNNLRLYALAGAAAVALILAPLLLIWMQTNSLDQQISDKKKQLDQLEKAVEAADRKINDRQALAAFEKGDVNWLDQLRDISLTFPKADRAIVTQWRAGAKRDGGLLVLEGVAADPQTISDIKQSLADARRTIGGSGGQETNKQPGYAWQFKETIAVSPPTDEAAQGANAELAAKEGAQ